MRPTFVFHQNHAGSLPYPHNCTKKCGLFPLLHMLTAGGSHPEGALGANTGWEPLSWADLQPHARECCLFCAFSLFPARAWAFAPFPLPSIFLWVWQGGRLTAKYGLTRYSASLKHRIYEVWRDQEAQLGRETKWMKAPTGQEKTPYSKELKLIAKNLKGHREQSGGLISLHMFKTPTDGVMGPTGWSQEMKESNSWNYYSWLWVSNWEKERHSAVAW